MVLDADVGRVLRAKYRDWCSARLADEFVRLTPDQIYGLARDADEELDTETGDDAGSVSSAGAELTYRLVVKRVTDALYARMQFPTFEEWVAAYEEAPERFDEELLGLWREG